MQAELDADMTEGLWVPRSRAARKSGMWIKPTRRGVSLQYQKLHQGNTCAMARPSKGKRHTLKLSLDAPVRIGIISQASEFGLCASQYIADRLALHVERPDLVRELGQGVLASVFAEPDSNSPHTTVRCDVEVYALIAKRATDVGRTPTTYVADFCAGLVSGAGAAASTYGYQEVLAATG